METVVRFLRPHRSDIHTHLCVDHLNYFQQEAYPGEQSKTPPRRELWLCLVDIVQHIWRTGEIPQELGWTVLVLIPKSTTNIRGFRLLETLWKVVEVLINTCISASLHMHDVLHGFRSRRGTGTDIIELNIAQDLACIDQDPLFLVFLDIRKAYDTLDQDRLLVTLEGYVAGPWLCEILDTFWECQQVVPIHN